jgi:Recombinase zinc beta ribbon domain
VREGTALLQGLAICGHCGRRLHTHYQGRQATPGYHCSGKDLVNGRGVYCLTVGGVQIDAAVTTAFLTALTPAALDAALVAAAQFDADHDAALAQWRLAVERARYDADRAERRYRAVEPEHRLVARGLRGEAADEREAVLVGPDPWSSAWRRRHCIAGSRPESLSANSQPRAPPGAFA